MAVEVAVEEVAVLDGTDVMTVEVVVGVLDDVKVLDGTDVMAVEDAVEEVAVLVTWQEARVANVANRVQAASLNNMTAVVREIRRCSGKKAEQEYLSYTTSNPF